jgi:ABC-type branched-subunit amino acid transport system substrate-binding protein
MSRAVIHAVARPFRGIRSWHSALPPIRRALNWALVGLVVGGLVAVGIVTLTPDRSCGAGVDKRADDDECTGVTDGGHAFMAELGPVSDRIKAENTKVTKSGKAYATIALMIPMTFTEDDVAERAQVVREVQGAYIAQYRANHESGDEPAIRLVLANPGRDMTRWKEVSDQLAGMAHSGKDRLRAVFGFNLSITRTEQTIAYLTREKGIAVVGGPITADDLGNDRANPRRYPGLAKIVPSNRDQARALTHHLKVKPRDTFLVEDTHADDLYARSLRAAFRTETEGTPYSEQYDSSKAIPNDFVQMVNNLCDSRATTVYFSGRPPALAQLIRALGKRGCADQHYRVVTVSGASTLAYDPEMDWDAFSYGAGLTVEYATITHENAWTTGSPPATGGSAADFRSLSKLVGGGDKSSAVGGIGPTGLADGRTITTYDSATTAIAGIRNRTTTKGQVPDLDSIAAAWPRLHGDQMVRGASGWICLDGYGMPYDKAVAIVKLSPRKDRHIEFEKLAWPDGRPPSEQCTAAPD